jgi:hypothetical protein
MALLALLGVFVVFKRQEITSELQGKDNQIVSSVQDYLEIYFGPHSVALNYSNVGAIPEILLQEAGKKTYRMEQSGIFITLCDDLNFKARIGERKILIEKRKNTLNQMTPAFYWILSCIIISLTLLPFIYSIHTKSPYLEALLIMATIITNILALVVTKRFVWIMLKD